MPKATRAAKAQTNPDIKVCIDRFSDAHLRKHGFRPRICGGKDGKHMRDLLNAWGRDWTFTLIDEFFATTDPRVVRSDYTIGALASLDQHLMLCLRGSRVTDATTLANLDAAARASTPRRALDGKVR